MSDLHLNYFGGSGGFLALHLLLLSDCFVNDLNNQFNDIIHNQWQIADHNKWRDNETWPNNYQTAQLNGSPKLFFYCNLDANVWNNLSGTRLLLYTDLPTHLLLSRYKNCWLYHPDNLDRTRDLDFHFELFYNNVRDSSWPDCHSIKDSQTLPANLQKELLTHSDYQNFIKANSWHEWFVVQHKHSKINNDIVYKDVATVAKHSHIVVKLQDMVNTNGQALLEPLGLTVTQRHCDLIAHWKSLHSDEILSMITSTVDSSQTIC